MSVKEFSPDIATQLASEDFYNLRRNAIGQNTKAKIFQLLNFKCELCGRTGEKVHLHHIIPIKTFDCYKDPNTYDNVICLCETCHRNAHRGDIQTSVIYSAINVRHEELSYKLADLFQSEVTQYVVKKFQEKELTVSPLEELEKYPSSKQQNLTDTAKKLEPDPIDKPQISYDAATDTAKKWEPGPYAYIKPVKQNQGLLKGILTMDNAAKAFVAIVCIAIIVIILYLLYLAYIWVTQNWLWVLIGGFVILAILAGIENNRRY